MFYKEYAVMKKSISISAAIIFAMLFLCGTAFPQVPAAVTAEVPAAPSGPGVRLTWKAPTDVTAQKVSGYNVYRSEEIMGHYTKLNQATLTVLTYDDKGLTKGKNYYYKVTTVFKDGSESKPTDPVGMEAGAAPGTPQDGLPVIDSFTSDALGRVTYLGEEPVFILIGEPGLTAVFVIDGVATDIPMSEVKPGVYKGSFRVGTGIRVRDAFAEARVTDAKGGKSVMRTPAVISLLGVPKPSLSGLYAGILESDRVGLNWPKSDDPAGYYRVYRDTARIVGTEGMSPVSGNLGKEVAAYIDADVSPGTTYYYVLVSFAADGGLAAFSENLEVKVPGEGHVSGIETVDEDSGGRELVPGDTLKVAMKTSPGGKAFFTLGSAVREREMSETAPGVYSASYTVNEGDGVFKSRVAVSFKDAAGKSKFANSATFVSLNAPRSSAASVATGKKPLIFNITDDTQAITGPSRKLTAGKTFTVMVTGEPGNKAYFCVGDGIWKVPMLEDPSTPGVYKGQYTVRPGDSAGMDPDPLKRVYVTGYLVGPGGALSDPASAPSPVVVDTTCDIKVELSAASLPADARSQSKVTFTVTDADGLPVRDRRLSMVLEPPPQYTGVVGGGGFSLQQDNPLTSTIGRLEADFDNLTDSFGRVSATYTTGFAAKTAMIVARDFSTGSLGMGYVTTSISSSVNISLQAPLAGGTPITPPAAPVYQLQIDVVPDPANPVHAYEGFSLGAVPDTLTADGVSRANVIATLTKDGLPVSGMTVLFAVSGAGGSLTSSSAVTDLSGRAQVFYIAGIKAGKALITATEPSTGITATKVITLLADAPSKIYVKAYPDTLPADGVSASRVVVEVADVNSNPTENVQVKYSRRGGPEYGTVSADAGVTDARGACDFIYTAGTVPGVATVDVTASSPAPTDDQIKEAASRVVAPLVYDNNDFTELVVLKWYKSQGDLAGRGEPLALVGTPLGDMVVYSPVTGTLDKITVDQGVNVMEGKEIGLMR